MFCFLIISLPNYSYGQSEDSGFLAISTILTQTNTKIFPAEILKDGTVLPVFESDKNIPKVLLSQNGINIPLVKKVPSEKIKLKIHTCGQDEFATPWNAFERAKSSDRFIATGLQLNEVKFEWLPVSSDQSAKLPKCVYDYNNLKKTKLDVGFIDKLKVHVFFANFQSAESIRWVNDYKKYKEQAYKIRPPDCKLDLGFQRVGLITQGKCEYLIESLVNCEGQGYQNGQFDRPLGLLIISKGIEVENWLIFLAHGYEGDAFLGILLTNDKVLTKKNVHFYVYSGC